MRHYYLIALLTVLSATVGFSQVAEICNNGIDDDFDGFIDCYDGNCANNSVCDGIFLGNDADCEAPPPVFPRFTMSLDFSSPNETTNHLSRMAIGDLDRDGVPEIVTMNRYTRTLYVLNGNNGSVKAQRTVAWEPYWEIAIANLDNDACAEIYFIGYQEPAGPNNDGIYMFAFDCGLNPLWETAERFRGDPINFGVADFDGDGREEIYAKDEIYDAKTGLRIVKSTAPSGSYGQVNGGPVAVDMMGDSRLELVIGLNIYQVNFGARTLDAGSLTLLQGRNDYFIRNEYNATSVADYNLDGFLDVLASGSTTSHNENTTVFFWDVHNNTVRTFNDFINITNYTKGWVNGTGRLNVADLDGDGKMNVSYVSGRYLYALKEDFTLLWRVNINEETSGYTGCTLFDFNGDGKAEIVYRDERFLYIIQGTDGSVYSQQACISRTNREYPIVADVDADGSTELCVTCGFNDTDAANNFNDLNYSRYSHIRVFKSAAEPWVPARRVWNQHGYFVVNVNDDLTIPRTIQKHNLVFSTGNCTQGPNRPLNKFLNQAPFLNSEGCPTYASADIAFLVNPTIVPPQCPNLNFTASFQLTNLGDVSVTGNIPVTFYTKNPKKAGAVKLNTINLAVNQLGKGDVVTVTNAVINGIGADSLYVVLNDAGTTAPPITLPNTGFFECDYDNIRGLRVVPIPVAITAVTVSANETCSATLTGSARAFVPVSGGENTADYNFYWSNGNVAKPLGSEDYVGAVYNGIASGTYTVYARHKTANCGSNSAQVTIGTTTSPFPPVTIDVLSNQTSCSPFNGKLEVKITGGVTGYQINWFDQGSNSLGISGPIASNLPAGSYIAVISRGPCNASVPATVSAPVVPDAQARVVQDVVDCTNPNSGSISADALLSGVVQNPANFTFTWYRYNNVTNTRGTVLPPANGTGPTRTGLAVGFYQVEVKENSSQCPSTITPIVEVKSNTVFPDPPIISVVAPQTSCDPANPNGILTAAVTIGGVPQNAADFTFQWFKGQNTLPANLVTTVTGTNGQTVNKVAGGGIPYTVKVTNAFNCSSIADRTVPENIINPVVTLAQLTPNSICDPAQATNPNNGSLRATVTFNGSPVTLPDPNYEFTWRDPSNASIGGLNKNNPVLSGQPDGNAYSVTVVRKDVSCNSNTDTEPILRATVLPALATTSTGSTNCDPTKPNGTVTVNVTNAGPTDAFTYQWYTGTTVSGSAILASPNNGNTATARFLGGPVGSPNPYTVRVVNTTTGCVSTATQFVVDERVLPVLSFSNITPNTICRPSTLFTGALTAQVNNQVGAISDYVFTWYNDAFNNADSVNSRSTGVTLDKLAARSYTVETLHTITGCKSTAITTQVPDGRVYPAISFTSVGNQACDINKVNGTLTANVTNGGTSFTYAWQAVSPAAPIGVTNQAGMQQAIKLGAPGVTSSYQVLVTNTSTGCQNTAVGQVSDISQKPTLTVQSTPNTICATFPAGPANYNGQLEVTAVNHPALGTSGITYEWFNTDAAGVVTTANTSSTTSILSGLSRRSTTPTGSGKYGVRATVVDLGCTSDVSVNEVLDNLAPVVITTSVLPSTNCTGGIADGRAEVTSPVGAGFAYQWYDEVGVDPAKIKTGKTNALLGTDLQGGSTPASQFTVLVTNLNDGCQNNASVHVLDNHVTPTITLSVVKQNTICDLTTITPDGELLANVGNVGANYTVTWTGGVAPSLVAGAHSEQFRQLRPGAYSATVTDDDTKCVSAADAENILNNLTYPDIAVTTTPQTSCDATQPNGALSAIDNTGTTGRTYDWFNGIGTAGTPTVTGTSSPSVINGLESADYTIRITINATGCTSVRSPFVPENITNPTVSLANISPVTICATPGFTPNGVARTTLTGISTVSGTDFTVYYVRTVAVGGFGGGTYPTDPTVIKASTETYSSTSAVLNGTNPPDITNLRPGYLTALVIDNNTTCESTPQTVQIVDGTDDYDINLVGVSGAGVCNVANPGGNIEVDVLKNGVPCATCLYTWYDGTPQNTAPINFFNQLPNMGTAPVISNTADLGPPAGDPIGGVEAGAYTLVTIDNTTGCGNYFVGAVPNINPPVVTTTPTNPTLCVNALNATNNGAINVSLTPNGANTLGYTINIYSGFSANPGNLISTSGLTTASPALGAATALNHGDYFVEIIDEEPGNKPCPMGYHVQLLPQAFNPRVTFNTISPNTSCTPATTPDGKVTLTVTKETTDTTVPSYRIESILPSPLGFTAPLAVGASGSSAGPINGFRPQSIVSSYTITVVDNVSSCFTEAIVSIPDQQSIPSQLVVTPTPEEMCAPGSNGAAVASLSGGEPVTAFDFNWFKNVAATLPVIAAPLAGGGATTGERLNQSKIAVPADWAIGTTGFGSGDRTYYARAIKNNSNLSGVGCPTSVVQVTIPDAHIQPNIAFTTTPNSFCTAVNPGDIGDGVVVITPDADPGTAGSQNSSTGWNYSWTNANAGLTSPQNNITTATFTIDDRNTGSLTITALNRDNGCIVSADADVLAAPFFINITDTDVANQLICTPDGQIDVREIVVNRAALSLANDVQTSALPLTNLYDFEWYPADASDPNTRMPTRLQDSSVPTPVDINAQSLVEGNGPGVYLNMGAGTYYVIAERKTGSGLAEGCRSAPVRVDVLDQHRNPVVTLAPLSNTSCVAGTGDGQISVSIADATDPSFGTFTYTYAWTVASGLGTQTGNDGDADASDFDSDVYEDLLEGTYDVTVTNEISGCSTPATVEILKNATPIFVQNVTATDQITCVPGGDGTLTVTSITLNDRSGTTQTFTNAGLADFDFRWYTGSVASGNQLPAGGPPFNTTPAISALPNGTYQVIARRIGPSNSIGMECESAPFTAIILDKRVAPVASLTPFANTSCDPAFFEGSIEVRVSDLTTAPGAATFTYTWDNVNNPSNIGGSSGNNGNGSPDTAPFNDNDVPAGLRHGTYNVTVRSDRSQCESVATTTLFQNATPIIIPQATATPQIICFADGSIEVDQVNVTDRNGVTSAAPFADFDFIWSGGSIPSTITTSGASVGGTVLDAVKHNGIGFGTYFVVAKRIAGNVGRGCESAPYRADILDNRIFPEVSFTQVANSSCSPAFANGEISVTARETSGSALPDYTFSWKFEGLAVTAIPVNTPNTSQLTSALNGNYEVTATNIHTNCTVVDTEALLLDQSRSTPNVISVTPTHPVDCNPSGAAAVTKITIGSTTNSILFPTQTPPNNEITGGGLNAYDYEWYAGSVANANRLPLGGPPFANQPSISALLPGTYYVVVHDPTTDCRSGGKEVVIIPDNIVYPVLNITQTARQVLCSTTVGSASLAVTADGQDDSNTNYTFAWFANATHSGTSFAPTSTVTNLLAGTYSVTIHNVTTNCNTSDFYLVADDAQVFTPIVSTGSQPRTLCVGTDGELVARVINVGPTYPFPYNASTFTADVYFGSTPNLSAAPDLPAIGFAPNFVSAFEQGNLNEGFYTVRIRDNNTGCTGTAIEQIRDARVAPIPAYAQVAPVTNCDPLRPNGVGNATANGTFVGYTFDWYEGTTVAGTPVYSGPEFGEMKVEPQLYTVRVTNVFTGCTADVQAQATDGTVPIERPKIEVLSNVTSCVIDNGALTAFVGHERNTRDYIFNWYNGTEEKATADNVGENYIELPAGDYSVTATSRVTGCKSPLVTDNIVIEQAFPEFDFIVQNASCDKDNGYASLIMLSNVPIERIEWFDANGNAFLDGPNFTDAVAGNYRVKATTFFGCEVEKDVVILPDIRPYNGVSKNSDGMNEYFHIDCIGNFESNVVKIYNRAGTLVYEAVGYNNDDIRFEGKSNRGISPLGVNLPDGTYFYIVDKRDGTKPVAGYLEIVN